MRQAVADWASWRRVAIIGLTLLVLVLLAGSVLPDPAQLAPDDLATLAANRPRTLALARIFPAGRLLTSPWLMTVPVLLALAIGWNLVDRIRRDRRQGGGFAARFTPQRTWAAPRAAEEVAAVLATRLSRRGYKLVARSKTGEMHEIVARRGRIGFWGSIAFHVGLIVALLAVTASVLGEWRGKVHLVEGEEVALDVPGVVQMQRQGPLSPAIAHDLLQLTKCDVRYQDDRFPIEYRADVLALDASGALRPATIRVNDPIVIDGQRLLMDSFGVAPVLTIDRGGERLVDGPVSLSLLQGSEDTLDVPRYGDRLRVRWFGDLVVDDGQARSRSDLPRHPALGLTLERGGARVQSMLLRRGEVGRLGAYRIAFPEARYWTELTIERDPGVAILVVALVLASVGFAVRLWDHDREIRVRVSAEAGATRIAAAARSRYFPALIDRELDDLEART